MHDIKLFENPEFGQVRTIITNSELWLVGSDVAKALGYKNTRDALKKHVSDEDKGVTKCDTLGGKQDLTIINESGMYSLILSSKLESAKRFKHWVTSEVLPEIRKNGSYNKPLSATEMIKLQNDAIIEVSERVDKLENDMPLLGVDMDRVVTAVNRKVVSLLGGKESVAYKDKSLRGKTYHDAYEQLKREFGVSTYKAIKRNQLEFAIDFIKNVYMLPTSLKDAILEANI